MSKKLNLIIAGGGSGGHVLPGVAVADAWKAKFGEESKVLFVGARGGLEEQLVPKAGYSLELLHIGSLKRVSLFRRLKTFFQLPFSLLKSFWILIRERPRVTLGVGGYASGPFVLVAALFGWMVGTRTAILEVNSIPGFTNRVLGKFVKWILASFPGSEDYFPKKKVELTGTPIRKSFERLPSAPRDPFKVFIFGGSQGAVGINDLVMEALPILKPFFGKIQFIHQTGERDYDRVFQAHEMLATEARVEKFIDDMRSAYAEASLLICRAGASTLFEIAAVRRAAILIPLPTAADNHQEMNARVYVDRGAAKMVLQNTSTGEDLADTILELFAQQEQVDRIEKKVAQFDQKGAVGKVLDILTGER